MSSPRSPRFTGISAAILAGGSGTRMGGVEKAFLEIGGEPILDRQLRILAPRFAPLLIATAASAADPRFLSRGLLHVADRHEGAGPMAGLHASLAACGTEWLFALACDLPFLDGGLMDGMATMAAEAGGTDALVPLKDGRPEPLHALYRPEVAPAADACLENGRRAMTDFLATIRPRYLTERDLPSIATTRSFSNLNTPDDLADARGRA